MSTTAAQQQAIEHDGHLLIVAGPGSGKTTTSVAKAQRMLADPSRSLIMVTFTKEGADEMRRRLDKAQEAIGQRPFPQDRLRIGTFHSIALQHLYAHRRKDKVLSPAQQSILLNEAMKPFMDNLDMDGLREVRKEFESYMYAIDRSAVKLTPIAAQVVQRYLDRLQASHAQDLYYVMRECALAADSGAIPPMRYTDMLVDEGQDTDELQKVWIFAHARAGLRVTIVGDDDQSIYEWRQALGYAGMKSFLDTFRARRIELGDNFRSREEILVHAVRLVQHNKARLSKHLVARRGPGGRICAYVTATPGTQCDELSDLFQQKPELHTNTAVLARKNHTLNELELSLSVRGIAYVRVGKSIWDESCVATYVSLLQSLSDGSTVGVFAGLDLAGVDEQVRTALLRSMRGSCHDFFDGEVPSLDNATSTDMKIIKSFAESCRYWRNQLRAGGVTEVVLDCGDWVAGALKSQRAKRLVTRAAGSLGKMSGSLNGRLQFATRRSRDTKEAAITLMTMHASKGLEFETVHILDASKPDGLLDIAHIEAERRLMYVAITRAKDRCVAWYSESPHPSLVEADLPVMTEYEHMVEVMAAATPSR